MKNLTQKELRGLFYYAHGQLFWRFTLTGHIKAGKIAGGLGPDGYHRIKVNNQTYLRSRLVFCYHYGFFPELFVDHKDQIRNNDHIENLREVSRQCNSRNRGNPKNNTSGIKGVSRYKKNKKWAARITIKNKRYFLGLYPFFDDAVCARLAAEQCLGWTNCDSSSPAYRYVKECVQNGV